LGNVTHAQHKLSMQKETDDRANDLTEFVRRISSVGLSNRTIESGWCRSLQGAYKIGLIW